MKNRNKTRNIIYKKKEVQKERPKKILKKKNKGKKYRKTEMLKLQKTKNKKETRYKYIF